MVRRSYVTVFTVLTAMTFLCVLASISGAAPRNTTLVSVDSSGTQATGGSGSPSISDDGRYVAFTSNAANLVVDDTNGTADVFVRDRQTGTTERVSVGSSSADSPGTQANNGTSFPPSISDDGRYVAFTSNATNLVVDDTNNRTDVFVRDRQTGTTERVSVGVSADGSRTQANESSYGRPSISSDGRFVVFSSWASNLVPYHDRIISDVFVHDRQTGTTKEMSVGPIWQETNGTSFAPSISSSGRYVAFFSTSSDLESGDTNNATDVFVRDRDTDADEVFDEAGAASTQRVRVDCAYSLCASHISRFVTSISSDGRYVTFPLPDSNLVAGDTNGVDDIFVHDRQMRATQRVNVHGCGTQANGGSLNPRISDDGRFVAFDSAASNLVAGDTNTFRDVFVRNLQGGTIQRVSVDSSGAQANGHSGSPSISSDGTYVAFSSGASNLVANDTNGLSDIFVHGRQTELDTPPSECTAPTSTASATTTSGADYTSGTWTNEDVKVTLSAQDNKGGSGLQDISYSATGADAISPQTVVAPNLPATFTIDAEGTTTISYSATDKEGNNESPTKTFTVTIDKSAPTVDSVYPADAATDVGLWEFLEATFSEPMDPDTLTPSTFTLTRQGSSTPVAATVSYESYEVDDSTYNVVQLWPSSDLAWNTTYTATIKGGASGAKALTGYPLERDYSWTFTTAANTTEPDTTAPSTTHTLSPQPNANGWNNENVSVTLNAADAGGSEVKEIVYSASGAQTIPSTTDPGDSASVPISTEGETTISYFATDNAGNQESPVKTFTVKLDKSAPTLDTDSSDGTDGITPNNRQTGVSRNIMPTATFSDEMDPASLRTSATLYQWNAPQKIWRQVSARVSVAGKTATLDPYPSDPTRLLAANKKFKVTITTGAKNLAGIPLESPKSWIFTTGSS